MSNKKLYTCDCGMVFDPVKGVQESFEHFVTCPINRESSPIPKYCYLEDGNTTLEQKKNFGTVSKQNISRRLSDCLITLREFRDAAQKNPSIKKVFQPDFLDKFIQFMPLAPKIENQKACFMCQSPQCHLLDCEKCSICQSCLYKQPSQCKCRKPVNFIIASSFFKMSEVREPKYEENKGRKDPKPKERSKSCFICKENKKIEVLECGNCFSCFDCLFQDTSHCKCNRKLDKEKEFLKFTQDLNITVSRKKKPDFEEHSCFSQNKKVQMDCGHFICEKCLNAKKDSEFFECEYCRQKCKVSILLKMIQLLNQQENFNQEEPALRDKRNEAVDGRFKPLDRPAPMEFRPPEGINRHQGPMVNRDGPNYPLVLECKCIFHENTGSITETRVITHESSIGCVICLKCVNVFNDKDLFPSSKTCPTCEQKFTEEEGIKLFGRQASFIECAGCNASLSLFRKNQYLILKSCRHALCKEKCFSRITVEKSMRQFQKFSCPYCSEAVDEKDLENALGFEVLANLRKKNYSCDGKFHLKKNEKVGKDNLYTNTCGHRLCLECIQKMIDVLFSGSNRLN